MPPTDLTNIHTPHRMPPTDLTMAAEESLVESGTSRGQSQQPYAFTVQPSMTAPVSLTGAPKGDSPKNGNTPAPMASTLRATEHRDTAREGMPFSNQIYPDIKY